MAKKFLMGLWWTIVVAGAIIGSSYYYLYKNGNGLEFATHVVNTGDILVEVKVSGEAKLLDEQQLSFGQEGKITKIFANVWDNVEAGQVLAELDLDVYNNTLKNAELQLANSKLALQKLLHNDTSLAQSQIRARIREMQNNLNLEEEQYLILTQQLEQSLQSKKNQLAQRSKDLEIARQSLQTSAKTLVTNVETQEEQNNETLHASAQTINDVRATILASLDDMESHIVELDKIFAYSPQFRLYDDKYEAYLSSNDASFKRKTKSAISHSYNILKNQRNTLDSIESTPKALAAYIINLYNELEVLVMLTSNASDAINASEVSIAYTEATIDSHAVTVATARTSFLSYRDSLNQLRARIDALISDDLQQSTFENNVASQVTNYKKQQVSVESLYDEIALLQEGIATQKSSQANQLERQQTKIDTIKNNIALSYQELEDIIDGPDSYDINQAQNAVRQAELSIENIREQKDDYQIVAEFNGRIRSIDITEWEQYNFEDREFVVIENPDLIELELTVSQIDIVDMKEWNPVLLTFDAYPQIAISSTIDSINGNPIPNKRGGTSYKATVLLEKQNITIYAGMTALAIVTVEEKRDTLVVPSLAIDEVNGEQVVYVVQENNTLLPQEVTVGMSDNFYTEVLSGVSMGDEIRASVITDEDFAQYGISAEWDSIFGSE